MLVELTMTEQWYRAVLEVDAGIPVIEVAERFGVSRQAVHRWIGWYREEGLDGLANRSSRPRSSPAASWRPRRRREAWAPARSAPPST
ncbi:helix-turn-helix domain-containing protein [Dactylosporangium sp. NPDC048998]|uniref:helix-turn-helix domain-containing protein n=1 Tax=Dactylosporangium sp. NPDC048998 TaxID=3363976 RepID=UPI00371AA30A